MMNWSSRYLILVGAWFSFVASFLPAQTALTTPAQRPAFEVASIRPAALQRAGGEGSLRTRIQTSADSLTMENIALDEMVQWAYGVQENQVVPANLLDGARYDIRARAAARATEGTLRLMLQDLLARRFKVRLHREAKKTDVYELVVARGGPKLGKNKAGTLPASYVKETLPRVEDDGFVFSNVSLPEFAEQLSELRGIDIPVVDRTGIQGVYDIRLKSAARAMLDADGPSLFTLIHEQLGLRLVSAKQPIDVVVVDHAERPSAN